MNRIFGTMLFIALLASAWNIIALVLSLLGLHLPAIDSGVIR